MPMNIRAQNLIVIMSDEHNPDFMGCSGHSFVKTPNLDGLAARGTRFDAAYTNCPICVPARASFATGRYTHQLGYWDNAIAYDGRIEGWGHRLQDAGMRVESIGKLHYRNGTDPTGFDKQHIPMHIKDGVGMVQGSVRGQFPDFRRPPPRPGAGQIAPGAGPGETSYTRYDRKIAEIACDWIANAGSIRDDKPWVLFVSFVSPHYPLTAPPEFFEMYRAEDLPLPLLDPRSGYQPHPWSERLTRLHSGPDVTPDVVRRALASYAALCSFVDAQIGEVLRALDTADLTASTRIVYTSDHGELAGSRGMWGKSTMYREATGVPMILAGSDVPSAKVCHTPVSLVDLYPTILHAAGLPVEDRTLPGRSLLDLSNSADDPERLAFSEYHAMGSPSGAYMIRQGRYKYHYYVGYPSELFDVESDPDEVRDLAADPAYAATLAACEKKLREIVDPEETDKRAKDDQKALVKAHGGPEAVFARARGGKNFTEIPPEVEAVL